MKRVLIASAIAAVVWALVWAVVTRGRYSWRQKLTLTVETPAGEVPASSVSAVGWRKHWILTGMGWSFGLTGEAVVVEVTRGWFIFALLKGAGTVEYMGSVAVDSTAGREGRVIDGALFGEVKGKRSRAAGVIAAPKGRYPMPVMFDDVARPGTVRRVDPEGLGS